MFSRTRIGPKYRSQQYRIHLKIERPVLSAGSETSYGDPVEAAVDWARQGAQWIHLVDLDAAFGRGSNVGVIRKVIKQVKGVHVEV